MLDNANSPRLYILITVDDLLVIHDLIGRLNASDAIVIPLVVVVILPSLSSWVSVVETEATDEGLRSNLGNQRRL